MTSLRTIRHACLAAGLTLALAGTGTPVAEAGTYTQYTCKLPDGSPAATDGWSPQTTAAGFRQVNTCVAGETLRTEMLGVGMPVNSQRLWRWTAPADTQLQKVELYRSFALAAGDANATPTMSFDAGAQRIEQNGSSLATGNGVATGGDATVWNTPANRLVVADPPSLSANELSFLLGCFGSPGRSCPSTGTAGSTVELHAATFTMQDNLAPDVTAVGGSLTTAGAKKGTQTVSFRATDAGAGIYRTFLDVDGATVATATPDQNGGRCADAVPSNSDPYEFQYRVPCPLTVDPVQLSLDTTSLSDGVHTVRVRVEDAAGNESVAYGPAPVVVQNATTPTPVDPTPVTPAPITPTPVTPTPPATTAPGGAGAAPGSPAAATPVTPGAVNGAGGGAAARLSVAVLQSNQRSVRVSYGRTVTLSGRLTTPEGDPVVDAEVEVLAQVRLRGAGLVRIATVRTDRSGGFRYVLPAGPSRLVRFGYRAHAGDAAFAHTADIDVKVGGKVSFRVSRSRLRNGQTLVYRGTVAGVGARRPLVQVQVRNHGRWVNVCVVRSRAKGAWSCRYRFRRTFTPTTYTFRALVRKQEGLPYETDASPRRSVRVRP